MSKYWQNWGNVVLGLLALATPWMFSDALATTAGGATGIVAWNMYLVGAAIAALAAVALFAYQAWEEWTNVVLGAWLLISPWLLGFSASVTLMWSAVVLGALVVVLAIWAVVPDKNTVQGPPQKA